MIPANRAYDVLNSQYFLNTQVSHISSINGIYWELVRDAHAWMLLSEKGNWNDKLWKYWIRLCVMMQSAVLQNPNDKPHHIRNLSSELWTSPIWLDISAGLLLLLSQWHRSLRRNMHIYRLTLCVYCLCNFFYLSNVPVLFAISVSTVTENKRHLQIHYPVHSVWC